MDGVYLFRYYWPWLLVDFNVNLNYVVPIEEFSKNVDYTI